MPDPHFEPYFEGPQYPSWKCHACEQKFYYPNIHKCLNGEWHDWIMKCDLCNRRGYEEGIGGRTVECPCVKIRKIVTIPSIRPVGAS